MDFDDSKSKDGYSPMDSSSFRGKNQNLSRSFHAYQIDALGQTAKGKTMSQKNIKWDKNLIRQILSEANIKWDKY